jgi:hypothetical protein
MEALSSSETSVLTRATQRNIPEHTTLHSHRRENLKSCTFYFSWQKLSAPLDKGRSVTSLRSCLPLNPSMSRRTDKCVGVGVIQHKNTALRISISCCKGHTCVSLLHSSALAVTTWFHATMDHFDSVLILTTTCKASRESRVACEVGISSTYKK